MSAWTREQIRRESGHWDDDPAHVERAQVVAGAIGDAVPLDSSVRLLEYGAGTGLVSRALRNTVGPIMVADTSAGMRKVMEDKVAAGVIADARVRDLDGTFHRDGFDDHHGFDHDALANDLHRGHIPGRRFSVNVWSAGGTGRW